MKNVIDFEILKYHHTLI